MLKFLTLVILILVISIPTFAQSTSKFDCAMMMIKDNITKEEKIVETKLGITVSDYGMRFDTGKYWKFDGDMIKYEGESNMVYIYANDDNKIRCRVWFSVQIDQRWVIAVEYDDYTLFYYCIQL